MTLSSDTRCRALTPDVLANFVDARPEVSQADPSRKLPMTRTGHRARAIFLNYSNAVGNLLPDLQLAQEFQEPRPRFKTLLPSREHCISYERSRHLLIMLCRCRGLGMQNDEVQAGNTGLLDWEQRHGTGFRLYRRCDCASSASSSHRRRATISGRKNVPPGQARRTFAHCCSSSRRARAGGECTHAKFQHERRAGEWTG